MIKYQRDVNNLSIYIAHDDHSESETGVDVILLDRGPLVEILKEAAALRANQGYQEKEESKALLKEFEQKEFSNIVIPFFVRTATSLEMHPLAFKLFKGTKEELREKLKSEQRSKLNSYYAEVKERYEYASWQQKIEYDKILNGSLELKAEKELNEVLKDEVTYPDAVPDIFLMEAFNEGD